MRYEIYGYESGHKTKIGETNKHVRSLKGAFRAGNQVNYIEKIKELGACEDALAWLRKKNYPTLQEAWDNCERGDWMLWLLRQTVRPDADKLPYVRVAAASGRLALKHYEDRYPGDDRPRKAIEAAERYAEEPSDENRIAAAAAARAAIDAANAADAAAEDAANAAAAAAEDAANAADAAAAAAAEDAANAAYAAAEDAANAAYAAADAAAAAAAEDAANAVAYAANAAYSAAYAVAYAANAAYAELAEIVRRHFPTCPGLGNEP